MNHEQDHKEGKHTKPVMGCSKCKWESKRWECSCGWTHSMDKDECFQCGNKREPGRVIYKPMNLELF